jgi:hypothetical protein
MIVIELYNREYDPKIRSSSRELAARIEVEGMELRVVEGDPEWAHIKEIVLNHPDTKDDLTFEDDPELWALTVPEAFRTGDTVAEARSARTAVVAAPQSALMAAESMQKGWN